MSFNIIRNAKVSATIGGTNQYGIPFLEIEIEGQFRHSFSADSKESALLTQMDLHLISTIFSGGTYVFYNDVMRDYRRGDYKGFIHTDEAIDHLSNIIGVTEIAPKSNAVSSVFNRVNAVTNNNLMMGGEWDKFDLDISSLGDGGSFTNRLMFKYSVFSKNIRTSLEVERLICTNGMVGLADFLTYEVPVISGWEDNLNVAANKIKPEISEVMRQRYIAMSEDRATLSEAMAANALIDTRFSSTSSVEEVERLRIMLGLTDVQAHMGRYYKEDAFNARKSKFIASDLTQFDVYNILTEASSHTQGTPESDMAIQRLANKMMFDGANREVNIIPTIPESIHSDPNRAFFGTAA